MIALFLGHKRGSKEENVFKLAFDHPNAPIYRIHNRTLAQEFYRNHTGQELGNEEMFCVFRHSLHMDEYEVDHLKCIKASSTYRRYAHFYNSERHPKLLTMAQMDTMMDRVLVNHDKMFMFVFNNSTDPSQLHEFKLAVHKLPKSFVYLAFNLSHDHQPDHLYSVFRHDVSQFVPGTLYAIDHNHLGHSSVAMDQPITRDNIIKFAKHYFQGNQTSSTSRIAGPSKSI